VRPIHAESPGDFLNRPAPARFRQQNKTIHNRGFVEMGRRAGPAPRPAAPRYFTRKMA
jgi:hypothetical protein